MEESKLNNNALAFIALCNEYCGEVENAPLDEKDAFVEKMVRMLPRIYISALDLRIDDEAVVDGPFLEGVLEEDYYDAIRRRMETLFGADDTYLEVFEEDMKYSDTPIAAYISENLADIFQVLYNFIEMVKDAPTPFILSALVAVKEDFSTYWGQILCNVMRALNHLLQIDEGY
ncbi:MAG: DUF5063 domain-containing protein [Muribaculaceae bacterium]|nr:DUF5063 domain-containing protein [Muribaculaceae bacterium]MBP5315799.1 DUF5063 domain-containing protein [Muribaculaceae bacterium]MBR4722342.1 DUF5063 domain-containing protein [Muribaculaceae bacterium]MBR5436273.1 DUF5063 domain-containing protein [Muribaculaceae bacterium]MBR5745045.1 DUF5063 domain-containing protein [Muribaculaceae bacterium]